MDEMIYLQIHTDIDDLYRGQELFRVSLKAILIMALSTSEAQSIVIYNAK